MSAIPAYFKGGIAPGSHVNVTYIGDLETTSLEEVRIIAVTGEDPDTINDKHISFTVTGTIIGSTANTITVQTDDGAIDTFRTENAQDLTAGGMEYGDYVCVTFHPSKSKSSNNESNCVAFPVITEAFFCISLEILSQLFTNLVNNETYLFFSTTIKQSYMFFLFI